MQSEYSFFDPESIDTKNFNEESLYAFSRGKVTTPSIKHDKLRSFRLVEPPEKLSDRSSLSSEVIKFAIGLDNASQQSNHAKRIEFGRNFTKAGEKKYGELDNQLFIDSLSPELAVLTKFTPRDTYAEMIKKDLVNALSGISISEEPSKTIDYEASKEGVLEYLAPLLNVVPSVGRYTTQETVGFFTAGINAMGLDDIGWGVDISQTKSIFTTSSADKKIYIPDSRKNLSAKDIRRLMAHEIGVHASKSVKLSDDFEEGLGIAVEAILDQPSEDEPVSIKRARKRYLHLGLALGADGKHNRNSRQVFEITWRLDAIQRALKTGIISPELEQTAKSATLNYIKNIFRGTDYRLPGVVYMRPKIYYEGYNQVVSYVNKHSNNKNWLRNALHFGAEKENN